MAAPQIPTNPIATQVETITRDKGAPALYWDDVNQCYRAGLLDSNGALVTTATIAVDIPIPSGSDFSIPAFDSQEFTYFTGTNNIETRVFKLAGTTVATLTFAYVNGGAANDDLVASITKS